MFISKLVLFIALEFLVGLLVFGGFLFYKSRLYRLLQKIYAKKEKAQSQQANQTLISQNKQLIAQLAQVKDAPLEVHVEQASSEELSLQLDQDHHQQLSALGLAYQTVQQMLEEQPELDEDQSKALNERIAHILNIPLNSEQSAQIRELQHQIEFLKDENALIETKNQNIERLEAQIAQLKSIDATTVEQAKAPKQGDFADEIYKLKCEKFDMMENINRMKLDIERLSSNLEDEELLSTLQKQVVEQGNYIKQSDVVVSLLEKELEAANALIDALEKQSNESTHSNNRVVSIEEELENLKVLQETQRESLSQLKEKLNTSENENSEHGENEERISNIEQNMDDADKCIESLRSELSAAQERIQELELQLSNQSKNAEGSSVDNTTQSNTSSESEADEELEELLKKLINDSQEMLTTIADLEQENKQLKEQLA